MDSIRLMGAMIFGDAEEAEHVAALMVALMADRAARGIVRDALVSFAAQQWSRAFESGHPWDPNSLNRTRDPCS